MLIRKNVSMPRMYGAVVCRAPKINRYGPSLRRVPFYSEREFVVFVDMKGVEI